MAAVNPGVYGLNNVSAYSKFEQRYSSQQQILDMVLRRVGEEHRARMREYGLYWDFYEGKQWDGLDPKFEVDERSVTLNRTRRIVNAKADFCAGAGFTISIPEVVDRFGVIDTLDRQMVKAWLDYQWGRNSRETWLKAAAIQGMVTGDVFVKVYWNVANTPQSEDHVRVSIVPSVFCFPEWSGRGSERVMTRMTLAMPLPVEREVTEGIFYKHTRVVQEYILHEEEWTADYFEIRVDGEVTQRGPNVLGEIPFVHIQNQLNGNGPYGYSDLADLIPIQRQLNEKATDISEIINYHGTPQTWVTGAKPTQLERGPDNIWALPGDSEIGNLELQGDLKANMQWVDKLEMEMSDLSAVPNQIINPTQNISNTPGVALHLAYMPVVEARKGFAGLYGEGLQRIHRLMLRLGELFDPEFSVMFSRFRPESRYSTNIDLGEPLPRDETLALENSRTRLEMGLTDRILILMRLDGIGEKEAEEIVKRADADRMKRAEVQAVTGGEPKDLFGKARRPDPVVQGDRISNNSAR